MCDGCSEGAFDPRPPSVVCSNPVVAELSNECKEMKDNGISTGKRDEIGRLTRLLRPHLGPLFSLDCCYSACLLFRSASDPECTRAPVVCAPVVHRMDDTRCRRKKQFQTLRRLNFNIKPFHIDDIICQPIFVQDKKDYSSMFVLTFDKRTVHRFVGTARSCNAKVQNLIL